MQPVERTEAE